MKNHQKGSFGAIGLNDRMRAAASRMTEALEGLTPEEGQGAAVYFFLLLNAAMCYQTRMDPGTVTESLCTIIRMQFDVIYAAYAAAQD